MHIRYLTKFVFLNLILFIACIFLSSKALANTHGCPSSEDQDGIENHVINWLFVGDSDYLTINRALTRFSNMTASIRFHKTKIMNPLEVFYAGIDQYFYSLNKKYETNSREDSLLFIVTNDNPILEARKAWEGKVHRDYFYNAYTAQKECYIWSWLQGEVIVNYGVAVFNLNDELVFAKNKVYLCGLKHHFFKLGYLNAINIPDDFLMTKDNIKSSKNYEIREDNFYFLTRLISSFGPKLNSGMTRIETKNSIKKYLKDLCFAN